MNETSSDRKEAGGALAGPRNPWMTWLVWAILAPVLYVLSIGPVVWLTSRGYFQGIFAYLYAPLSLLPHDIRELIARYIEWWVP